MTETWAGLLRDAAAFDDADADVEAKLRRLASLLEQITPETIEALSHVLDDGERWICERGWMGNYSTDYELQSARLTRNLLQKLSTAPTEETG